MSVRTMRAITITVHNNQKLEVFVRKLADGFEVFCAGLVRGRRVLIDHHLTRDDLEGHLKYAKPGDLIWRNAARSEIPARKHKNAIEYEETIKRGVFWDYEQQGKTAHQSLSSHLSSIIHLAADKKELATAKKAILGRWTDGILTFNLEPNNRLLWSCKDQRHSLNVGERIHGHPPDWWNFALWKLHFMNHRHKCGTYVDVLHVGESELHIWGGHRNRMAHVFRRA